MHQLLLKDILLIFICAIPVVLFFNRLLLPTMIGFLITGALMGTQGFGLIEDPTRIDLLAELGLALLLFSVGLEFSFDNFKQIVLKHPKIKEILTVFTLCIKIV